MKQLPYLLPDKIENFNGKSHLMALLKGLTQLTPAFNRLAHNQIEIDPNAVDSGLDKFISFAQKDVSLYTFIMNWKAYKANPRCLVFSESLTKAFSMTDMNYATKYLPETFSAYIELRGWNVPIFKNQKIEGFFIEIIPYGEGKKIYISIIAKDPNAKQNSQVLGTPLSKFLEEGDVYFLNLKFNGDKTLYEEINSEGFKKDPRCDYTYLAPLINAVVFAHNQEYELNLNEFYGSKKAIETQKKIYSNQPFYEFHKDFNFVVDATVVSGHFRFQPFGEGRKKVKLIYIEPHVRRFKTTED